MGSSKGLDPGPPGEHEMTTISKREALIAWASASRKIRHVQRATCSVIELDASGRVISTRHIWL
jgi:hypothetical protein